MEQLDLLGRDGAVLCGRNHKVFGAELCGRNHRDLRLSIINQIQRSEAAGGQEDHDEADAGDGQQHGRVRRSRHRARELRLVRPLRTVLVAVAK